jgi:hypothetical protein
MVKRARGAERATVQASQEAIVFDHMAAMERRRTQHLLRIVTLLVAANQGRIEIPVETLEKLPPTARIIEKLDEERNVLVLTAMVPRPAKEEPVEEPAPERVAVYDANGVLMQPSEELKGSPTPLMLVTE